jgi:hypothetical protein
MDFAVLILKLHLYQVLRTDSRNVISFVLLHIIFWYFSLSIIIIIIIIQDKPWAPHTVCSVCVEDLRNWTKGKKNALQFSYQWYGISQ